MSGTHCDKVGVRESGDSIAIVYDLLRQMQGRLKEVETMS